MVTRLGKADVRAPKTKLPASFREIKQSCMIRPTVDAQHRANGKPSVDDRTLQHPKRQGQFAILYNRSFQGLGRLRHPPCPNPPCRSGEHMRDAGDPERTCFLYAAKEHFRLAVEQFQDLAFEVPPAKRQARQVPQIDRRLVGNERGQFLEEKGLTQVLQEDQSL
jgi:hypothetical protein